jgi:hypothetical protein
MSAEKIRQTGNIPLFLIFPVQTTAYSLPLLHSLEIGMLVVKHVCLAKTNWTGNPRSAGATPAMLEKY